MGAGLRVLLAFSRAPIIASDAAEPLLWLAHFDPLITSPGLGKLPDTL